MFSVQDALSTYSSFNSTYLPSAEHGSGTLFRSGCVVDGILNCTAACQDVNQIFADPHTLQNCMVMASISLYNSGVILDGNSTALAEDFSIYVDQPDFQSLASRVNQTIQDCLYQYLEKYPSSNPGGMNTWQPDDIEETWGVEETGGLDEKEYGIWTWGPWYYDSPSNVTTTNAYIGFPSVCNNILAPLNADVGGIGVRKATLFKKTMLTYGRFTSLTGFKAASPSQPS